jgi:hypothetical protein
MHEAGVGGFRPRMPEESPRVESSRYVYAPSIAMSAGHAVGLQAGDLQCWVRTPY